MPAAWLNDAVSQIERCITATATHVASANRARESNDDLLDNFLDANMSILQRDADQYDWYARSIREEYEFVERIVFCDRRAEILESFLPTVNGAEVESAGRVPNNNKTKTTASSELLRGKGEHRLFIYATVRGREL